MCGKSLLLIPQPLSLIVIFVYILFFSAEILTIPPEKECSTQFFNIFVIASLYQALSHNIFISFATSTSIETFFRSHIGSKFFLHSSTIWSKFSSLRFNAIVLVSNLESFNIALTKTFIFKISFLISFMKSFLTLSGIFSSSNMLSNIIEIDVSGVFN